MAEHLLAQDLATHGASAKLLRRSNGAAIGSPFTLIGVLTWFVLNLTNGSNAANHFLCGANCVASLAHGRFGCVLNNEKPEHKAA